MLKKTIKYVDYNGNQKERDFYFNLSKAEIAEMELEVAGGFSAYIKEITDAQDTPTLMKVFKNILLRSYGVKSSDGERFIKTEELKNEFVQSEAYSELFMELVTNADAAAEFINGVVPADLAAQGKKLEVKAEK